MEQGFPQMEGLGRVTIEGQMAGCLVIGAAAGATTEIVSDGETGLLYELGNPEDLADKLIYAEDHPEMMNQIAIAGQERACQVFNVQHYLEELQNIYEQIAEKSTPSENMESCK